MDQTVQGYTPHLKKVLKSYQAAATTSLQGPNSFMGMWEEKMGAAAATKTASEKKSSSVNNKCGSDYDTFVAPPPFPIQQPPIFTPPDQTRCERSETKLESETISCFVVGGEKRLCLPQILNTVLRDFSLQQINGVCDELHIFCSRCNPEQLEVLKVSGILPLSAPSCGLITKTDAERLCSALLHSNPPKSMRADDKRTFHIKVYHQCFGKTQGVFWPDLYQSFDMPCIECSECRGLFTPQAFVCHTHQAKNRTCHWGFDSLNWKSYLLLAKEHEHMKHYRDHLEQLKARFDNCSKYKRKQIVDDLDNTKRFCLEEHPYSPVLWDPAFALCYASWARMCGIKSWPPSKERKYSFVPTNLPSYIRDSLSISVPSYIAHDASLPLDADVMTDINRHYISHNDPLLRKRKVSSYTETNTSNPLPDNIKNETWLQEKEADEAQSDVHIDSEDTMSDTTLSTLSGAEAVFESADEDEWDVYLDNDISNLKKLLEETNLDKEMCEKILIQVKLLIIKNRNSLHNALYSKKIIQKELEKMRAARRIKLNKIQKNKKNLHQEMERMKNEFKEQLSEIKDTKEMIDWGHKESEKPNNNNGPDYLHLLSQNEYLQKQVFSLQREIDKMKDYLAESSTTTLEENANKSVDISTSLTTTTTTTIETTTIKTENTENDTAEATAPK